VIYSLSPNDNVASCSGAHSLVQVSKSMPTHAKPASKGSKTAPSSGVAATIPTDGSMDVAVEVAANDAISHPSIDGGENQGKNASPEGAAPAPGTAGGAPADNSVGAGGNPKATPAPCAVAGQSPPLDNAADAAVPAATAVFDSARHKRVTRPDEAGEAMELDNSLWSTR
jgi:hypothetical protein